MNDVRDVQRNDAQIKWALKQAALRQRKLRRLEGGVENDGLLLLPAAAPSPEHYHIIYNVPKDNLRIPYFGEVFIEAKEAYQKIYDLGMKAMPNAEFYGDDGLVGLETRLHGRSDLWWIVLEVAACIKSRCVRYVAREQQKRKFTIVPEQDR